MINRLVLMASVLVALNITTTASQAQQIWSKPGLGSEQFTQQRYQQPMMQQWVIVVPQQHRRRLVTVRYCGLFACQMRQVWVNE